MDKTTKLIKFAANMSDKYAQIADDNLTIKQLSFQAALSSIAMHVLSLTSLTYKAGNHTGLALTTNQKYINIIRDRANRIVKLTKEHKDPKNLDMEVKTFIQDIRNIKLENVESELSELGQDLSRAMADWI